MSGPGPATTWTFAILATAVPAGWACGQIVRLYGEPPPRRALVLAIGAMALVFAWAIGVTGVGPALALSLPLGWTLTTLALVDIFSFRLPDPLTFPLAVAGLLVSVWLPGFPLVDHLAGALVGYSIFAALRWLYRRLRGREGIGLGDAKLLSAAGAWLGWAPLPSVLLIACATAFLWIAMRAIVRGRAVHDERLAFGAPLCAAIWVVWLHGPLTV
jgi:leader peptidase (prepilin peptidase)/N-methyltransferase